MLAILLSVSLSNGFVMNPLERRKQANPSWYPGNNCPQRHESPLLTVPIWPAANASFVGRRVKVLNCKNFTFFVFWQKMSHLFQVAALLPDQFDSMADHRCYGTNLLEADFREVRLLVCNRRIFVSLLILENKRWDRQSWLAWRRASAEDGSTTSHSPSSSGTPSVIGSMHCPPTMP